MSKLFTGILFLVLATVILGSTLALADAAFGEFGVGAEPGDQDPKICVKHRNVTIGWDADPVGINALDYRTSLYAFTGEIIDFTIVVRDPNGALDIGFPKIRVGTQAEVLCNEITIPTNEECDGLGLVSDVTDRMYHCVLTIEPGDPLLATGMYGEKDVKITAYNSAFEPTDGTHVETWFFNPALSMSVSTSDSQAIHFEAMPYGADDVNERTVHSLNRLQVKNTAEGGVNMWMYLAGTDLFDPSGASKCPSSNVLSISNMAYRAWSGTQWQSWEGWVEMSKYDQNAACDPVIGAGLAGAAFLSAPTAAALPDIWPQPATNMMCYGGLPVPYDHNADLGMGNTAPWLSHLLTNQGKLEVEFKLSYPLPCVGTFSQGSLMVFGKAV